MSLRDDFQPKWKLLLKWGWLSFAVFILMAPTFYTVYISFNELGFGAKYYNFTFQWYENVFSDKQLIGALGWTMLLALITLPIVIPFGLLSAKLYKQSTQKVWIVFVLLSPLFVPADILASALLVFFKNLNKFFTLIGEYTGIYSLDTWFDLGIMTAVIGLIVYTLPYVFVVIMITMARYRNEQTEAARDLGASAWRAFWEIEFPQIRAGVFSACAFVVILTFNEYTRTSLLKGGFDTFTSVLISQMLNTGMSEESYAMASIVSLVAVVIVSAILIVTAIKTDELEKKTRIVKEPNK
jgi:spermidine/putrescine transport system permease protein